MKYKCNVASQRTFAVVVKQTRTENSVLIQMNLKIRTAIIIPVYFLRSGMQNIRPAGQMWPAKPKILV